MKFLIKKIYIIFFLLIILLTMSKVFAKDSQIQYTRENISNYFSGIISADRDYYNEAFKHLKQVGLERFLEEGWELPDYVTEFDRPGIKIWEPEGGWMAPRSTSCPIHLLLSGVPIKTTCSSAAGGSSPT